MPFSAVFYSMRCLIWVSLVFFISFAAGLLQAQAAEKHIVLPLQVTSPLPSGTIPMDVEIDFAAVLKKAGLPGVFDPNSVQIINLADKTRTPTPHALSPHIAYGDRARVRWLVTNPAETKFEIHFTTAAQRPVLRPRSDTPLIGVGDLLRYSGPQPQAVGGCLATRLVDLNGDGVRDLLVTDYYTTEPLWPERIPDSWSPFICYPGVQDGDKLLFGNGVRLRYREKPDAPGQFFIGGYMHADVGDVNGDGLPDLAFAAMEKSSEASKVPNVAEFIHIYLNSGKRDEGGMPVFVYTGRVKHPKGNWGPVRIVDMDRDGSMDFVVGSLFSETNPKAWLIRNTNPAKWPFKAAEPVSFSPGAMAGFLDVDGDGIPDSVCVTHDDARWGTRNFCSRVAWHKGLGGSPPQYGPEQFLEGIDDELCEFVSTVDTGAHQGVLVSAGYMGERIVFYELQAGPKPRFKRSEALAINAQVRGGDQPTPFICDWNDDGKWDLLYGGGFGWVRVFINEGTNEKPALRPGQHAMSEGKPILLHMTQFFPGIEEYWHDLGYVHPAFVDWDGDGLRDLVMSNVGNRIYWYRNIGKKGSPTFGPRQQVVCDGYEPTPDRTAASAKALGAGTKQWKTFPLDTESSPFWWRARVGFGDLNGDGLMDLITADAGTSSEVSPFADGISLFLQYRDPAGQLKLRRDHVITLPDGSRAVNVRYQPPSQTIVHDWDGDGLLDLIMNPGQTMKSGPALLRNIGTKTAPKFAHPKYLKSYGEKLTGITKHGPYLGVGDMDGDGRPDLIASTEVGSYVFFRRTAMDMDKPPTAVFGAARVESD